VKGIVLIKPLEDFNKEPKEEGKNDEWMDGRKKLGIRNNRGR
jgi:hypothetical protein